MLFKSSNIRDLPHIYYMKEKLGDVFFSVRTGSTDAHLRYKTSGTSAQTRIHEELSSFCNNYQSLRSAEVGNTAAAVNVILCYLNRFVCFRRIYIE